MSIDLDELAAMTARAESAAALAEAATAGEPTRYWDRQVAETVPALARDVLSLAALYTASQAALTEALAELTAARAEIAHGRQLAEMFPEAGPE